jgi:methionine synthase II (cobalamin-independent)
MTCAVGAARTQAPDSLDIVYKLEYKAPIYHDTGGDRDSTHSADVDYAELLPGLFELKVGSFYIALAGKGDRIRIFKIVRQYMKPEQRIFIGVVAPINPRIETPEAICGKVIEAAKYIPAEQLGTTDDCGFSPFGEQRREGVEIKIGANSARW